MIHGNWLGPNHIEIIVWGSLWQGDIFNYSTNTCFSHGRDHWFSNLCLAPDISQLPLEMIWSHANGRVCLQWDRALAGLGPQVTVWSQAVLVSEGCYCNKGPQIGWLKITEIYCLRVMEVRNLKSRLKYGSNRAMLFWDSWESTALSLPSFLWWPSVLGLQLHRSLSLLSHGPLLFLNGHVSILD